MWKKRAFALNTALLLNKCMGGYYDNCKNTPNLEGFKKCWWSRPRSWINLLLPIPMILFEIVQGALSFLMFLVNGEGVFTCLHLWLSFYWESVLWHLNAICQEKTYKTNQKLCNDVMETITFRGDSFITEMLVQR